MTTLIVLTILAICATYALTKSSKEDDNIQEPLSDEFPDDDDEYK